jgi:hypothetical protein
LSSACAAHKGITRRAFRKVYASDLELSRFHHFLFLRIEARLCAANSPKRAVFNN